MGQKFYANPKLMETAPNGARMFAPTDSPTNCIGHFAKVQNCPVYGGGADRLTCYATGYADTYFSIPACTRKMGEHVRGYFTHSESGPMFHLMDSHAHLFARFQIVQGIARALHVCAWVDLQEHAHKVSFPPGSQLDKLAPVAIDAAALAQAQAIAQAIEGANGDAELSTLCATFPAGFDAPVWGWHAGMQWLGSGVGLSDNEPCPVVIPWGEFCADHLTGNYARWTPGAPVADEGENLVPNLDCMESIAELMTFWQKHQRGRACAELFPQGGKGTRKACADLANYASNKATETRARLEGRMSDAQVFGNICERIYNKLPQFARW